MHARNGDPVRLVEERRGLVVLSFPVLDHEPPVGPVAVDGELHTRPAGTRIAEQPREASLTDAPGAEQIVEEVEYVGLVAVGSASRLVRRQSICCRDGT